MKRWLLVSCLVGLCGMLFGAMLLQTHLIRSYQPASWEKHLNIRAEEYAVYSDVLDSEFVSSRRKHVGLPEFPAVFWVLNETYPWIMADRSAKEFAQLGAPQDAIADFLIQNINSYSIEKLIKTRSPSQLMKQEELSKAGELPYAVLNFSRVGFDSTMSKAVVFIVLGCNAGECGSAHILLLSKQNGHWSVNNSAMMWIS